ncbi:MAG: hypothetical protein C0497_13275 [Gemmatimonas sp.]|nr:hypothetical protein [Gemmatimonas sp.]
MSSRETSRKVASTAGRVLSNRAATPGQKSAAASALTQFKSTAERSSQRAASKASKVMRDPRASAAAKSAAASTLAQRAK